MLESGKTRTTSIICRITDAAFLLVMSLYIATFDVTKTMLHLGMPSNREKILLQALIVTTLLRLAVMLISERADAKKWLAYVGLAVLVDLDYFMVYKENQPISFAFIAFLTLGMVGLSYEKVLKVYAVSASVVVFPAIAMAWTGAIENLVYIRDMQLRSSWGIQYPTDMMSLLFFLVIAVWVFSKKKDSLWFLIPGAILFLMSYFIADSRTGALCDLVFMAAVCLEHILSHRKAKALRCLTEIGAYAIFPAGTVVMNALVLAYRAGNPIAVKLNGIMSNRLFLTTDALNKYGLTLFGSPLKQTGMGGTTFFKPGYDFVDISYCLILLKYGIITLIVINILWFVMTRKAVRIGDWRLVLALAVIAFNSISEHHITQVNYDIFLVMPFAILPSKGIAPDKEDQSREARDSRQTILKETVIKLAIMALVTVIAIAVLMALLPTGRTLMTILDIEERTRGRRLLYGAFVIGIGAACAALCSLYKLCLGIIRRDKEKRKAYIAVIAVAVAAACAVLITSNNIIEKGGAAKAAMLEEEKEVIELVQTSQEGKLYVSDLPALYQKAYGGISTSVFNGEELARYGNTTVIMDADTDTPCFYDRGFLYLQISEDHALFTNDEPAIRALENAGYHLTSFTPLDMTVDMQEEADANGLYLNEDGTVTLRGDGETLQEGPGADLREGRYTVTYDLALKSDAYTSSNEDVCELTLKYYEGKYVLKEETVTSDQFDENGECQVKVLVDAPDSEDVDFCVYPCGSNEITVKGIRCEKTPETDVHIFYDDDQVKYREEYFDRWGEPLEGSRGYFAAEFERDSRGNIISETYYDRNNNKTLNSSGYAELRRTFNENNQDIRDEYLGIDGEPVVIKPGQTSTEFEYDTNGRIIRYIYLGLDGDPTPVYGDTWGGYCIMRREYDDRGRVICESYYDANDEPVADTGGFFAKEYAYDENWNRISEVSLDEEGNKMMNANGYCELRREINAYNQNVCESYYNIDGEPVNIKSGQASVHYEYDYKGRAVVISYYDINEKPVEINDESASGYQKVSRTFDEFNRVVREDFYDSKGRPANANEGYASRETIYEGSSTTVSYYRYYDSHGSEMQLDIPEDEAA